MAVDTNNVNGEFVKEVIEKVSSNENYYKGVVIIAAASSISYMVGKKRGFKKGAETYNSHITTYLKGLLAGKDSNDTKD